MEYLLPVYQLPVTAVDEIASPEEILKKPWRLQQRLDPSYHPETLDLELEVDAIGKRNF